MTNEQITLHSDSLDHLVEYLREDGNPTLAAIGNTIQSQRGETFDHGAQDSEEGGGPTAAIAFCGLPGAGKTHVGEQLAERLDCAVVGMGDAIRTEFEKQYQRQGDSSELGEFAAEVRANDPDVIPQWTADLADTKGGEYVVIDGVRSVTDYKVLNKHFENFLLVHVKADFYTRLERLQVRGREGEASFTAHDLVDRDENELQNLGVADLLNYQSDWADEYLPNMEFGFYDTGLVDVELRNEDTTAGPLVSAILRSRDWLPSDFVPDISGPNGVPDLDNERLVVASFDHDLGIGEDDLPE